MAKVRPRTTLPQSDDVDPAVETKVGATTEEQSKVERNKARDGDHGPQRAPEEGRKKRKVRVISGIYIHEGVTHTPATGWFDTDIDLVGRFGNKKFQEQ